MASQQDNKILSDASTIALDGNGVKPAEGDATCDLSPGAAAPPMDATCDLAPEGKAAPKNVEATVEVTCDFAPGAPPPATDVTCDLVPGDGTQAPAKPGLTTHQGEREATLDHTCDFDTGAVSPNVTADFSAGVTSGKDGGQTSAKAPGKTTLRPAVEHTQGGRAGAAVPQAPQQRVGRFEFKKFHAKGGMGEIWLVEDSNIGRPVALKRMLKSRQSQKDSFLKEAQVTGQLEHPGIIPVHELSVDDNGQPYYVMKFVQGQTLKAVIEAFHKSKGNADAPREVEWLRLLNIFIDLCQTIAYAHSRGVIHRDIKPDNVMVGAYGETLVLDWGLAKVVGEPEKPEAHAAIRLEGDDGSQTIAGSIKGSPFYFAPEVAAGEVDKVDQISDVFLLGGTLYEMVTGRTPRRADKIAKLIEMAKKDAPVPPRQLDPTVPRALDAICNKAQALKKEDRYQTAAALAEDLQRYIAGEPVSAYQETFMERTWRWVKKHRTGLTRGAVAAVILAVGATAYLLISDAQARERQAQAAAAEITRKKNAGDEIDQFHKHVEEARFYAANSDPVAEHAPALDASKVEAKANAALAIAEKWGPTLDDMPLEDKRVDLKQDIYELLLEVAQLKTRRAAGEQIKEAQALLDRAAKYGTPTQSYYRLRARCLDAQGQKDEAAADRKRETDPQTPTTAMDNYLAGEQLRVESLKKSPDDKDGKHADLKGILARRDVLNKAMASYREALRLNPKHYWSLFQIGVCLNGLGAAAEAAEAFSACIALRPAAPWGYSSRGLALAQVPDRVSEALADMKEALRLDHEFRPARLHRAKYYVLQKNYEEAEKDYKIVLDPPSDKRLREALFDRGQMYMERAMWEPALADFNQVVEEKLNIRTVFLHRARIFLVQEKPAKAVESLNLFLAADGKFDPESAAAYEQRGRLLRLLGAEFAKSPSLREGAYDAAMKELHAAVKKDRKTASVFDEMGLLQEKMAEFQKEPKDILARWNLAIVAYSNAIKYDSKDPKLLAKRGNMYIATSAALPPADAVRQLENAKKDFEQALKLDARHAESHALLGYAEAMLKQPSAAQQHATLATMHGAGDYLVLHNVASVYGALSKMQPLRAREHQDMAIPYIRQALELWDKGNRAGPNLLELIDVEIGFPLPLRKRPEFQELIKKYS